MPPVFEFRDYFDATVTIFDRELPLKIKRYPRDEADRLYQRSMELQPPRGTTETDDERQARRERSSMFLREVIADAISLDEGVVVDRGQSVTTGAGLIELFVHREDVLAALAAAVILENRVMPSLAKNLNSPRASAGGSEASIPARGGDKPGSTVESAASSGTAASAAATAENKDVAVALG